jgi:hypothetical protein
VPYVAVPLRPPPSRGFLLTLAAPGLALSLAITVVSVYAPPLIAELSSPGVAGAIIGAEGIFALLVPVAVGSRSDRTRSRLGSRMPFLAAGALLAVAALLVLPATSSLLVVAAALCVFYVGYFSAYAPYRALYPDCVDPAHQGRALGMQSTLREIGLGLALVGGGLLFATGQALPFVAAAALMAVVMAVFVLAVRDPRARPGARARPGRRDDAPARGVAGVAGDRPPAQGRAPAADGQRAVGARAGRAEELRRAVRRSRAWDGRRPSPPSSSPWWPSRRSPPPSWAAPWPTAAGSGCSCSPAWSSTGSAPSRSG